jgi:hypothetical protein
LSDAGVVGESATVFRRGAMGGKDRIEAEALRRLRAPQIFAGKSPCRAPASSHRQGIGHGKAGEGADMTVEIADHAADQFGVYEGPRGVMDQHVGWRVCGKGLKPGADRLLSMRAAMCRWPQASDKVLRSIFVKLDIIRVDDHRDLIDARMTGESTDGAGQHRDAPDRQILLWDQRITASRADASPGRDDEGRHAHETLHRELAHAEQHFVQCGKSRIAPARNTPYSAQ